MRVFAKCGLVLTAGCKCMGSQLVHSFQLNVRVRESK